MKLEIHGGYGVYTTLGTFKQGRRFIRSARIRVVELDLEEMLRRRILDKSIEVAKITNKLIKKVEADWNYVDDKDFMQHIARAVDLCKQLNERIQND